MSNLGLHELLQEGLGMLSKDAQWYVNNLDQISAFEKWIEVRQIGSTQADRRSIEECRRICFERA